MHRIFVTFAALAAFFSGMASANPPYRQSVLLGRSSADHLAISDTSQTGLDLSGNFTLEAWVKPTTSISTGQEYVIVSKWSSSVSDKSYLFLYYHNGQRPEIRLATAATATSDDWGAGIAYTLPTNLWSHVAVVFTASTGTAEFFVNASSIGTASGFGHTVNNGGGDFQIGSRQGLGSVAFDGFIDEVRVWNGTRTRQQLWDNFGASLTSPQTGLVGAWSFTCSYSDASGNGNNLTPMNYPLFSTDTPFGCGQVCSCS